MLSRWYRLITNEENNFRQADSEGSEEMAQGRREAAAPEGTTRKGDKRVESCCPANVIALTGMQLEYNMSQIRTKSQSETMMFSCAIRF